MLQQRLFTAYAVDPSFSELAYALQCLVVQPYSALAGWSSSTRRRPPCRSAGSSQSSAPSGSVKVAADDCKQLRCLITSDERAAMERLASPPKSSGHSSISSRCFSTGSRASGYPGSSSSSSSSSGGGGTLPPMCQELQQQQQQPVALLCGRCRALPAQGKGHHSIHTAYAVPSLTCNSSSSSTVEMSSGRTRERLLMEAVDFVTTHMSADAAKPVAPESLKDLRTTIEIMKKFLPSDSELASVLPQVQIKKSDEQKFKALPLDPVRIFFVAGVASGQFASAHERLEQTFQVGDVLGGRYQLLSKVSLGIIDDILKSQLEHLSWIIRWNALDLATQQNVVISVSEAGDPANYTAATRAAALHVMAGSHPNILKVLDVFDQRTSKGRHACVVTEAMGSDLTQVKLELHPHTALTDGGDAATRPGGVNLLCSYVGIRVVKAITRQIFAALDQLHKNGIVHMNIRKSSFVLDKPYERSTAAGARALDLSSDKFSLKGFINFTKAIMHPPSTTQHNVEKAAASETTVYTEKNLHRATLKLVNFQHAMPYKLLAAAPHGPLRRESVVLHDRDGRPDPQPPHLRPPEEILGLEYIAPAYDIWRAGLTVFSFATGVNLHDPRDWKIMRDTLGGKLDAFHDEHLQLYDMVDVLGALPREFIRRSPRFNEFFRPNDLLKVTSVIVSRPQRNGIVGMLERLSSEIEPPQAQEFEKFMHHVMVFDPLRRPTAADVLKHPWLKEQ